MATPQEGVGALLKVDSLFSHAKRQPMVLVQAYPRREGEVGSEGDKHPTPALVVQVEVVLVDPTLLQLQVGAVVLLSADGHQDAGRLSGFENHGHSVGFAVPQVLLSKIISALFLGCVQDGSAPFLGSILQPVLELIGDFRQGPPGHPSSLSIGIKKPKYSLWLLERLDQSVQQDSIKAPIPELDAILVMRDEGAFIVHPVW